jgi:hypothetical protein
MRCSTKDVENFIHQIVMFSCSHSLTINEWYSQNEYGPNFVVGLTHKEYNL